MAAIYRKRIMSVNISGLSFEIWAEKATPHVARIKLFVLLESHNLVYKGCLDVSPEIKELNNDIVFEKIDDVLGSGNSRLVDATFVDDSYQKIKVAMSIAHQNIIYPVTIVCDLADPGYLIIKNIVENQHKLQSRITALANRANLIRNQTKVIETQTKTIEAIIDQNRAIEAQNKALEILVTQNHVIAEQNRELVARVRALEAQGV